MMYVALKRMDYEDMADIVGVFSTPELAMAGCEEEHVSYWQSHDRFLDLTIDWAPRRTETSPWVGQFEGMSAHYQITPREVDEVHVSHF